MGSGPADERQRTSPASLESILPESSELRLRWLANILNSIYDGLVVVDAESRILYANPAYSRLMGVPVGKVLGKKLSDIEPQSRILEVLRTGKPLVDDPSHVHSVGIDIVTSITPLFEGEKLVGAVAIFRDVSEVLALQEKLRLALDEVEKSTRELQELRARFLQADDVVYKSAAMRKLVDLALRLAKVDSNVLITGESGVGKEVFAKLIHRASPRADGPFVVINCGSIPETLLESELMGYERGAFTGAKAEGKKGLLEIANGGTLFLDEVAELPLSLQVKLLRVIQEQQFRRVGGTKLIKVDVRFLAATNKDIKALVQQRLFREDLYYRLNVTSLNIPPLRERREDIEPLVRFYLDHYNRRYKLKKRLHPEVLRLFQGYAWPGNVRELQHLVERLVVSSPTEVITLQDETLRDYFGESMAGEQVMVTGLLPLREAQEQLEKQLIAEALKLQGSIRKAAPHLGVDHSTLVRKIKKYGLVP